MERSLVCYSSGGRKELDMTDHECTTITTKRKSLLLLLAMLTKLTVEDEGYSLPGNETSFASGAKCSLHLLITFNL